MQKTIPIEELAVDINSETEEFLSFGLNLRQVPALQPACTRNVITLALNFRLPASGLPVL